MTKSQKMSVKVSKWMDYTLVFLMLPGLLFLIVIAALNYPNYIDFWVMYKAGETWLNGGNPYEMIHWSYYAPAWLLPPLAMLSKLPANAALVFWLSSSLLVWIFFIYKNNPDIVAILLFMLNPFYVYGLILGSYDWLVLIGTLVPPTVGFWFLVLKPQVSFVAGVWWFRKLVNSDGFFKALTAAVPPVAILFFFIMLGYYRQPDLAKMDWNTSLFPWSIPVGLVLVWYALEKNDNLVAFAAAPLLSPYVAIQSWAFVLLPFVRKRWQMAVATALSWAVIERFM